VRRAAHLDDLDGPAPPLVSQDVTQDDHVVEHELLDAVAGHVVVLGRALNSDDRGDLCLLQGSGDPRHLVADDSGVGEASEDRIQ
jgi:hypothetical protein